ncbi:condensation domain-containing protein [Actinocorallia longicatena]|uniref:Condensation domain-containing protein n=1 Tax=Actinocorallia longicatena TaxID=111803 RepID=A0ABP6Q9Z6_9ACTN
MSGTADGRDLLDILPLSPAQRDLFLDDGREDGGGIAQLVLDLAGPLDAATLRLAAEALPARHANLRAAFTDRDISRPVQLIPREVPPDWTEIELAGRDAGLHAAAERSRRFDLARPPLLRFALLRSASDRHRLILTHHQILMDGRSRALLVAELFALYLAGGSGKTLPEPVPYRTYPAWLVRQDGRAAEAAWRRALAGLGGPTLAVRRRAGPPPGARRQARLDLDEGFSRRLTLLARRLVVTVNTLFQAAWAVVLGGLTGLDDVVFGQAVSGRPPGLPGVENMIGAFLGTLPVRVRIRPGDTLAGLLARLQEEQAELLPHHPLGPSRVRPASGGAGLFDTLMVMEDGTSGLGTLDGSPGGLRITGSETHDSFAFPIAFVVVPGSRPSLRLHHRAGLLTGAEAAALLAGVERFLRASVADPGRPLASLDPPPLRGPLIGPGEIEETLKRHPLVAQAFVVASDDLHVRPSRHPALPGELS